MFKTTSCYGAVALLAAAFLYMLNTSLESPAAPHPRFLLMSNVVGSDWERTLAGAQAAARDLGVDLDIQTTPASTTDPLTTVAQNLDAATYSGIALSLADPEAERDLINDLGDRTKLVTIGNDLEAFDRKTRRLCHVGCRQRNVGAMVARVVRNELTQQGKVALLVSEVSAATANAAVAERLDGFKQEWDAQNRTNPDCFCSMIEAGVDTSTLERASQTVSALLADPDLTCIIAFDARSAETAVKVLAAMPKSRRLPTIALESSRAILDAVADGSLNSAIFHDPYRDGYAAIERLNHFCHTDAAGLPKPGYGSFPIAAEIIRQENLATLRPRLGS
jgi:ribose transport system substrate-binding protein